MKIELDKVTAMQISTQRRNGRLYCKKESGYIYTAFTWKDERTTLKIGYILIQLQKIVKDKKMYDYTLAALQNCIDIKVEPQKSVNDFWERISTNCKKYTLK